MIDKHWLKEKHAFVNCSMHVGRACDICLSKERVKNKSLFNDPLTLVEILIYMCR